MRYVVILLLGILLGGGAAIFFLGAPPAKSAPGQAVQPPDQGGNPPATVVIALEQSFIDAVLATTFSGLGTPTFQLGQNAATVPSELSRRCFRAAAQTRSRSCLKAVA